MNYFKTLGIIFGLIALLKPFYMHILPWNEFKAIKNAYSAKRPIFLVLISIFGILAVVITWYLEVITEYENSIYVSIIFSFTAIKAINLLFNYKKFQLWVNRISTENKGVKVIAIDIIVGLLGLMIMYLSIEYL